MQLLLVRHAESANNRLYADTGSTEGRQSDPPLTELGHAQAQALADYARTDATWQSVTHLYSSLMLRSVQTARPLAEALGLSVQGQADAYEAGGLFRVVEGGSREAVQGRTHADMLRENAALLWPAHLDPAEAWAGGFEEPDGEGQTNPSDAVLLARARRVLAELQAAHGAGKSDAAENAVEEVEETVALVSHGHFVQYLLRALSGHGNIYFRHNNTGTTLLQLPTQAQDQASARPLVKWINRTEHLRAGLL